MLSANFAEGTLDNNLLHTPRATNQLLGNSSQSEVGGHDDEYIDSDDEEDNCLDSDDEDEISSQMDTSEHDFAHITGPQGDDDSFHLAESIIDEENRQPDGPSLDQAGNTASVDATRVASDITTDETIQSHTLKSHLTVVIKGVAYSTYYALLYYVSFFYRINTDSQITRSP